MDVTHDKTQALRSQMKHHEPVVLAFKAGAGSKAGGIGAHEETAPTLQAAESGTQLAPVICYGISGYDSNAMKSSNPHSGIYEAETARALDHNGGSPQSNQGGMMIVQPMVYDARGNGDGATVPTITGDHGNRITDYTAICIGNGQTNNVSMEPVANTLDTMHDQQAILYQPTVAHALKGKANCQFREDSETYVQDAATMVVRRLTPLECERLQGYPSEKKWDVSKMTKDEYIAWNLAEKNIICDPATGKVYGTRGPGGAPYKTPKELKGSIVNGYHVVSIRNGATKLICRVHRIVWISQHGIIPDGYVVDHINNDKLDNRIENLQLLTPGENSTKAREDGLYKDGLDNKATKLDPSLKDEIAYLYDWSGLSQRDLAELYGVSKSRIGQIIKEVGWTDIGEWTDSKGRKHRDADSPRYKALGNSIALPYWFRMCRRISAMYDRPATLGSLFDGIGGFPLCWERCNGPHTAIWASEIEEFCVAVTKKHFPEER